MRGDTKAQPCCWVFCSGVLTAFVHADMLAYRILAGDLTYGVGMRRNLENVKHLLDLVQAYADQHGVLYEELAIKWQESGGGRPMQESECFYLVALCKQAGMLNESVAPFHGGRLIQLTWSGHEYLDAKTIKPQI